MGVNFRLGLGYKSWGGIQSIWGIGEEWTPSGGINK